MCNDYRAHIDGGRLREDLAQLGLPLLQPEADPRPNAPPPEHIRPTDPAPVLRRHGDGVRLDAMRWGLYPPPGRKAPPVINFRSEGRRFGPNRCLIPADSFLEFTGTAYPKTPWRFSRADGRWMCIAGIWREGEGDRQDAFTMLTCVPGPDVAPIHDRQMVVLEPGQWARWLAAEDDGSALLQPAPAGTLVVRREEPARPGR